MTKTLRSLRLFQTFGKFVIAKLAVREDEKMFVEGKPKQSKILCKKYLSQDVSKKCPLTRCSTRVRRNRRLIELQLLGTKHNCLLFLRGIYKKIISIYKINC